MKMMKPPRTSLLRLLAIFIVLGIITLSSILSSNVSAAQITNRSLTLIAGSNGDGGSKPSGIVNHYFQYTIPTTGTAIGSIKFEYCTTAANSLANPTCVMPVGLDTTLATTALGSEAGSGATGFTLIKTTNGAPLLYKGSAAIPANGNLKFRLDNIQNQTANGTFFVRISTYSSTNATGSPIDTGTVAASTNEPIVLSGIMPESLVFCTGADILKTAGVPDCSTATSGIISFNQLFSPTDTASAVSQDQILLQVLRYPLLVQREWLNLDLTYVQIQQLLRLASLVLLHSIVPILI